MAPAQPVFFLDRSSGRKRVPERLRRSGWSVVTMAEHYCMPADETVQDDEWLTLAGTRRWAVLLKGGRIRYRESERRALTSAGIHASCLAHASLRADEMADISLANESAILDITQEEGPSLPVLSKVGVRRIALQAGEARDR